jgi:hypothetical protein
MSSCSKCFSKYHDSDDSLVIESFEDYSAGIFNDGNNNPYYNYLSAMQAVYNSPDYMSMARPYQQMQRNRDLRECFEAEPDVQQQLFNMGDYQDFYHNLFENV